MLFMVIERFRDGDLVPVAARFRASGCSLPAGLEDVDSWIEANFVRCFQLMRCDDPVLFQRWILNWRETGATFEIVPAVPSGETAAISGAYLDGAERSGMKSAADREAPTASDLGVPPRGA